MPEENYTCRPTSRVRKFGELVGQFFCGPVKGEQKTVDIEKTKTWKKIYGLGFMNHRYCDTVYDAMTNGKLAEVIETGGSRHTKSGLLSIDIHHDTGHNANLMTYLRINSAVDGRPVILTSRKTELSSDAACAPIIRAPLLHSSL